MKFCRFTWGIMRVENSIVKIEYIYLSARHPLTNLPMKTKMWRQILKCTSQWPKLIVELNKMHLPKVNFQYVQNSIQIYPKKYTPEIGDSSLPNYKSNETKSNPSYFSGNWEDSSRRHSNMTYGFNSQKGWTPILSNVNEQRNYSASRKEGSALSRSIGK